MQTTATGLVIGEKILSNDNRLITILTAELGVVHAFVKSIKKLGGSMAASTDLFTYSSFVLFSNKEKYSVNSAETLHLFYHLREDLEKTALASYLAQLAEQLCPEGEGAQEYLQLFLNCLHLLETDKRTPDFVKPVFELRLLTMAGFMPDLVGCQECGEYQAESFCFSPSTGTLLCGKCSHGVVPQGYIQIGTAQLAAMRHIIYSENKRIFQFKMSAEGLACLGRITELYLLTQLEKSFPSLDFYHRLRDFGLSVQNMQTDVTPT
ncbi:DNA repair protein RecO [uncultured Negativibacillus sp.]|uniref:DNA repair protein RecO n=1 Tax=uncultured Negativibacillus sp. TaxID=1980696 RepID=UPI0025ECA64E|nr:DNA repair protein RecO [uncultured Negativibacillus sp.]